MRKPKAVTNRWDLATELANLIRHERNRLGMSQRALGEALGFDPTYISHLEAGRKLPSLDALIGLAAVFNRALLITLE